ncbi:MAG TPA: response regulator [Polyangiaceae bacterium]
MTTTLLAVDDSKTMRRVFEITFSGEDFRTVLCASADDALSKLAAERPQVALVDAGLDGSAGYDLCQRIKASAPHVAVVMLASKQQPYDRARGSAAGADDFVDKPFDTQQMLDKITAIARKVASAPVAAVPAPVAAVPATVSAVPKATDIGRPRVQTLAYGAAQTPNIPATPSPSPAAVRPAVPVSPIVPAPVRPPAPEMGSSPRASAPMASAAGNGMPADFASKLGGLGLSAAQVDAVLALSREVVEQVVWEVVPTLAETLIKEEIRRLTQE